MGKVWFITGASSGFGEAFVRHALDQGHSIAATARNIEKFASIAAIAPERILVHPLDVTKPGDAAVATAAAIDRFGCIDVLVNNAGYGIVGAVEETPEAEFRAQMETNFFGAVAVLQAVLPFMRAQRSGAVVNISSLAGQRASAGFGAYSASKFALEGLSEALAQELAPFGIKVLIVEPGVFRTGFASESSLRHMPVLEAYRETIADRREFAHAMDGTQAGDPAKAAAAVAAALSAERTPLRLQLGQDSVNAVRGHAEGLLEELRGWEHVAVSTAFDNIDSPE